MGILTIHRSMKSLFALLLLTHSANIAATELNFSKDQLEQRWADRIEKLLETDKLPLIDLQTSLKSEQIKQFIPDAFDVFDEIGIALMAADGYQRPKDGSKGYRWSNYILELVNDHPDYFIPTTNGGTNSNWLKQKGEDERHYIDQLEHEVRSGRYRVMGELDFRHYMSSIQCSRGRNDRDNAIPLSSPNGHRLFALSAERGIPFSIHLEAEDRELTELERMLRQYPKAKVIVSHFGQLRHPEKQRRFTPRYVRHLLNSYPNLFFDLAIGHPNRQYQCAGPDNNRLLEGDTVIWMGSEGNQKKRVRTEYLAIFKEFDRRFVFASDYGGGRAPLTRHLREKVDNFRDIIRDLPEKARHQFAYRNAWRLLTGREWNR